MKNTIVKLLITIFIIALANVINTNNLISLEAGKYYASSANYSSSNLSRGSTISGKEFIVQEEHRQTKECLGTFRITAYSAEYEDCGKRKNDKDYGITSSGVMAQDGITIAADWKVIKPGTKVYIEGIGYRVVQDKGGAIKGNRIDLYINNPSKVKQFGVQYLRVYIIKVSKMFEYEMLSNEIRKKHRGMTPQHLLDIDMKIESSIVKAYEEDKISEEQYEILMVKQGGYRSEF